MSFYVRATLTYIAFYLYIRLWICRLLIDNPKIKRGVLIATDLMTIVMPITIFFPDHLPYLLKILMQGAGYSWAAIIACMVPVGLCFEPIRWGMKILGNGIRVPRLKIFAALCLISIAMTVGGYINATSPIVKEVDFDLSNGRKDAKEYRVVMFSDLHAGKLMTRDRVGAVVNMVNELKPDIVLMVGDILDDHDCEISGAVDELARIKAPLGKYAVLGNHEYYLGNDWSRRMLNNQGIQVLGDRSIVVDGQFLLAGRNDFANMRSPGLIRAVLQNVIPKDNKLPIILMDHTPHHLEEAQQSGVALQVSGHTHNGQLFPFNLVVKRIFEEEYGSYQKGDTHYFVSCGVGFWGPPLRTNSRPEVVLMKVRI
ncbi:metallophosphoesterase [Desulfovibrio sp. JC010]|uniref:metallophosphoesterase n=1 Tax=Desulfovibrio sp. JC010 TaxID=2593641 RepID=UPI0013D3162A|nr:metallophosphoesterase [Desulfovibrio sp. JC010]NDV28603.1 metallophosphoesterase [Desulfovibrio sp. JC010]